MLQYIFLSCPQSLFNKSATSVSDTTLHFCKRNKFLPWNTGRSSLAVAGKQPCRISHAAPAPSQPELWNYGDGGKPTWGREKDEVCVCRKEQKSKVNMTKKLISTVCLNCKGLLFFCSSQASWRLISLMCQQREAFKTVMQEQTITGTWLAPDTWEKCMWSLPEAIVWPSDKSQSRDSHKLCSVTWLSMKVLCFSRTLLLDRVTYMHTCIRTSGICCSVLKDYLLLCHNFISWPRNRISMKQVMTPIWKQSNWTMFVNSATNEKRIDKNNTDRSRGEGKEERRRYPKKHIPMFTFLVGKKMSISDCLCSSPSMQ